jgi:epsin
VELLSDVEKIRSERRKAKANRNKYTGVGSDGLTLGFESGGGRYGGDSLGSSYNGSYGNGGSLLDIEDIRPSHS